MPAVEATKAAAQSAKDTVTGVGGRAGRGREEGPAAGVRAPTVCLLPATLTTRLDLPPCPPPPQLPEAVRSTYARGQQLAAEKDAEGVVCVPASAVKPESAGGASAGAGVGEGAGGAEGGMKIGGEGPSAGGGEESGGGGARTSPMESSQVATEVGGWGAGGAGECLACEGGARCA